MKKQSRTNDYGGGSRESSDETMSQRSKDIMPNWCHNRLHLVGRRNEIDQCLEAIKGKNSAIDFNALISSSGEPQMRNYALLGGKDPIFDIEIWHTTAWRIRHWGTKWNAQRWRDDCAIVAEKVPGGVEIAFLTAWGPPLTVLRELSRRFPKLDVRLRFGGLEMDCEGLARFKKGEMVFYGGFEGTLIYGIPRRDWDELLDRAGNGMRRFGRLASTPDRAHAL